MESGGSFILGNEDAPMELSANIEIKKPSDDWNPIIGGEGLGFHESFGSRFFVGAENSIVKMHGAVMKTWTLLTQNRNWSN